MTRQRRANQADIAERLGVSVSTVSRALSNHEAISDGVRQDVLRLAQSLGYRAKHGQVVGRAEMRAVALVPLGSATSGLSGFYFGIVEGMKAQAAEAGLALDVRLVNETSVTLEMIQRHAAGGGVLLAGIDAWDELVDWSAAAKVPVVLVNGSDPAMRLSSVAPANFYGAYLAAQRLIGAGHVKLLNYSHKNRPTIRQRQRGFETAVADHPAATSTIVLSAECSPAQLAAQFAAGKRDETAIFAWNDIVAVELMEALRFQGVVRSIIGFDDLPIAEMATPRLSTIRVDREAIGRGAVRLLVNQFGGEWAVQQLAVGVSMVAGGTVHNRKHA